MASDLGGRHIICTLTLRMAATDGPLNSLFENKALSKPKKDEKRLSVESIYQKKTQLEHILLRPDTYIGSVEPVTQAQSQENRPPSPSNQSRRSSSPVLLRRESLNLTWSSSLRKWLQERRESAKNAKSWDDDESFQLEENIVTSAAPRSRAARTTKPVTYALDSDSDDY